MKINSVPSDMGLQQMAAKAQEARQARSASAEIPANSVNSGNATANGKNLSPVVATELPPQKPDHATGLARAIENLQQNAEKSPQAKGLQNALQMLTRNQDKTGSIDVQA